MREPVGILPMSAPELEEADGDVAADGDELALGDTTGPEWNVGSMLLMQRELVTASWVAGRRRASVTREGIDREGREGRLKGNGGLVGVEPETVVMDVDTSEVNSLRSLIEDGAGGIGSHGEGDLAPQACAPNHAGGGGLECSKWTQRNKCEVASVKRRRQLEEGKLLEEGVGT